jgi:hypothetical protein
MTRLTPIQNDRHPRLRASRGNLDGVVGNAWERGEKVCTPKQRRGPRQTSGRDAATGLCARAINPDLSPADPAVIGNFRSTNQTIEPACNTQP